jgi:hypothetical protein
MSKFTDSVLEETVLEYFESLGWQVVFDLEITPFGRRALEYKRIFPGKAAGSTFQRLSREAVLKKTR